MREEREIRKLSEKEERERQKNAQRQSVCERENRIMRIE